MGPIETIIRFEADREAATPRQQFDYADALREVGRTRAALRIFLELESAPIPESKRHLVSLFKGATLQQMGRFREAEEAFRQACLLDATTTSRVHLAGLFAAQERFAEAIDVLRAAVICEGNREEAYLNLALNQRALGQLDEARQSLRLALTLSPGYMAARRMLTDIQAALDLRELAEDAARHGEKSRVG